MGQHPVIPVEDWLQRARGGDPEAFGAVVETYQTPVFNLCYRMLSDPHLAEEAAQETFLRAFRRLDRYDERRPVRTWLLSIAAHHCIDSLRRRTTVRFEPLADREFPAAGNPEATVIRRESEADVARLLASLPGTERAIVTLRYWYDLSLEEISEAVGLSVAAVRTRLHRARRTMAGRLRGSASGSLARGEANEASAV